MNKDYYEEMDNAELVEEYRRAVENLPGTGARGRSYHEIVKEVLMERLAGDDPTGEGRRGYEEIYLKPFVIENIDLPLEKIMLKAYGEFMRFDDLGFILFFYLHERAKRDIEAAAKK